MLDNDINGNYMEEMLIKNDSSSTVDKKTVMGAVESMLYISGDPVSFVELQRAFDISGYELREIIAEMSERMQLEGRGILLFATEDTVQLVTNPAYNDWLVKLLAPPAEKNLSDSLLETLSVIAYRQPVTRADIESVRGVRCEYSVSQLLKQGFIREVGRKDCIGRPMMFGTTDDFLRRFGLHSLDELPKLPEEEGNGEYKAQ